jgi:membrane carboxypeptidase/penicillin-binding protein
MVKEYILNGFYGTFVVKIWMGHNQRMRRGYVQHVATQEGVYFLRWEKMLAFMSDHLDSPSNDMSNPSEITVNAVPSQVGRTSEAGALHLETIYPIEGTIN